MTKPGVANQVIPHSPGLGVMLFSWFGGHVVWGSKSRFWERSFGAKICVRF